MNPLPNTYELLRCCKKVSPIHEQGKLLNLQHTLLTVKCNLPSLAENVSVCENKTTAKSQIRCFSSVTSYGILLSAAACLWICLLFGLQ